MKQVAITFDVDYTDYLTSSDLGDEMQDCWNYFQEFTRKIPELKTTWFIRIDNQIGTLHGTKDFIFTKHADKISWLRENGHEIGWHFHSYINEGNKQVQNNDESDVVNEMREQIPFIKKHNLKIMRMGWAYHGNETMSLINEMGFIMDCTALPRPNYSWENGYRDWSTSPKDMYYPSAVDYRIEGTDSLGILEVPITTLPIKGDNDTRDDVERYINPAYHSDIFKTILKNNELPHSFNTVSHPYEFVDSQKGHMMLSFSSRVFLGN